MKPVWIGLAALVGTTIASASAQTPSEVEKVAIAIGSKCLAAKPDTPEAATTAIALCDKALTDLDLIKQAVPGLAGHDLNVFLVVKTTAEARVAASYLKIDGVRSARVCERNERTWSHVSKIDKSLSPTYAATIQGLVNTAVGATRVCRTEFGTPSGAPPLPEA